MDHRQNKREQMICRIRVKGILEPCWSDWFDGMAVNAHESGETLLIGPVRDQAALHGLLAKVRDMGMHLLAVDCVETPSDETSS